MTRDQEKNISTVNCEDSTADEDLFDYAIGVVNSEKQKIDLFPVEGGLNSMTRIIKRKLEEDIEEMENQEDSVRDNSSYWEKRSALVGEFGSKKSKRYQRLSALNRVDTTDNIASKVVKSAAASSRKAAAAAPVETLSAEEYAKQFLPPFNLTTSQPSKIYNFSDVVPQPVYENLEYNHLYNALTNGSITELPRFYPEIVRCYLRSLIKVNAGENMSEEQMEKALKPAEYLSHLILLVNAPQSFTSLKKLAKRMKCSEMIAALFLDNFLVNNEKTYQSTLILKNKLKCHICVLSLFLFSFNLTKEAFTGISRDVRLSPILMTNFFIQTGCRVKKTKILEDTMVSLKAPLSLPEPERNEPKRNRRTA